MFLYVLLTIWYVCFCQVPHNLIQSGIKEKPKSAYEQECCKYENIGKAIIVNGKDSEKFLFCPLEIPNFCSSSNTSCSVIDKLHPSAPSGYYIITPNYERVEAVYCDMEGDNCGGEGGWTRIANINMTLPGTSCPEGLPQLSFNNAVSNLCGRDNANVVGCNSTVFNTFGLNFTKICGRVRGYQFSSTQAFDFGKDNINLAYLDGVSITYGSPRHHIWSYVTGWNSNCPCNVDSSAISPSFVAADYYCETAVIESDVAPTLFPMILCGMVYSVIQMKILMKLHAAMIPICHGLLKL